MNVAALFREHHESLFRYLVRLTGDADRAADAAQEAFVRMVEREPREERPKAWLFTVAKNVIRDDSRTRMRRLELLEAAPDRAPVGSPPPDPEQAFETGERREAVRRALDALSERDRTILLMREEGFTHREIADEVGTTTKSVGTMIARALSKLADELPLDRERVQ